MTLQQQEHRQWLEGLREKYPVQAEAALRLWDGLLLLLPDLQVPAVCVQDEEAADPNSIYHRWAVGLHQNRDKVAVDATVLQDGIVDWWGVNDHKRGEEFPSPYAYSVAGHIELLENYFTEPETTSG